MTLEAFISRYTSQGEAARALGWDEALISKWRRGIHKMNATTAADVAARIMALTGEPTAEMELLYPERYTRRDKAATE